MTHSISRKLMSYAELAHSHLLHQPVYSPGKSIKTVAHTHGLDPADVLKLASNENPFGPSPSALAAGHRALADAHRYPDGACMEFREAVATTRGVNPEQLIVGCGSNEIFALLGHIFLGSGVEAVMGVQSFPIYKLITLLFGATPVEVPMPAYTHDLAAMRAAITPRTRLVFLPSPNNPTGTANTAEEIAAFVAELPPHVLLVFDEAYAEYLDDPPDIRPAVAEGRNVLCTRTFSKIYGLASLRLGYGYGAKGLIALLERARQPFNVTGVAQAAGLAAVADVDFVSRSRTANRAGIVQLDQGLRALGLEPVPSAANFILVALPNANTVVTSLERRGVIVRPIPSLPDHVRVSVGTEAENKRFLEVLSESLRDD